MDQATAKSEIERIADVKTSLFRPPGGNVLRDAKPGGIVLMHDGGGDRQRTVQALPQIITGLKQQGYRFVTVPELLKERGGDGG